MAKSMKKLLVEWNCSHDLFCDIPIRECKDDLGIKYSAWTGGFMEGSVQIEIRPSTAIIRVFRNKSDPFDNSKFYTFTKYKVFQAALEVVYHTFEKYECKYMSFAEFADVLEMILDVFPADGVVKHKPKKKAE